MEPKVPFWHLRDMCVSSSNMQRTLVAAAIQFIFFNLYNEVIKIENDQKWVPGILI